MEIFLAVILAMIAGFMNGSYAFPVKTIKKTWPTNTIWMVFSVFTFLVMPWIANFAINQHLANFLSLIDTKLIWLLLISGFVFGLGMVLFTFSLNYIGIGVSFLLNIGTGTVIATLLPIIIRDPGAFSRLFGLLELLAMIIFIIGIISAIIASNKRDKQNLNKDNTNKKGLTFGIISGVLTSGQGFAYSYALPSVKHLADSLHVPQLSSANVLWILLFNGAFIPYFLFFFYQNIKNNEIYSLSKSMLSNSLWLILMAVLYFICLVIFSKASLLAGPFGGVIAWPLLMIFIIFTSNFWGFIQGEWHNAGRKALFYIRASIFLMILAIIILAVNGHLSK